MPHDFLKDYDDEVANKCETYIEVIKNRVLERPDHVVFRFLNDGVNENESLSYKQLELKSKALGAQMQEYGKKGDRVLLLFPPGLSYVASIFSCFYSGFVAVPAYPPRRNHKLTRLNTIIADSGAGISIISRKVYNDIERNFADDEKLKSIKWIIYEDIPDDKATRWVETEIFPDDIALLQYTSGSTGNPKGVMLSQLNLLYNSEYIHRTFEFNTSSVGVNWLPIFHDMGLIGGVLQSAYLGLLNVGMPPTAFLKNPLNWLKAMEKYGGTTGGGPNFGFDYCLEKISDEDKKCLDLSKVKTFYCGAEPVRKPTMEAFSREFGIEQRQMYPVYGMAETTLIASGGYQSENPKYITLKSDKLSKGIIEIASDDYDRKVELVGCGHAWMETVIEIVEPETFNKLPELNVGEIWISGPTVAKGYWEKPEETERTFNAFTKNGNEGPFLRTGDLGFIKDGELYITGRLKDMIIIRGVNYYPNDIEFTIQKNTADFRQNGGAAIPIIKDGKEKLVIVQELERTALRKDNHDELISLIRKRVSDEYELDVYAVCLIRTGSIPLTSSGKIQRRQTKYDYLNKQLRIVKEWSRDEVGEDTAEIASATVPSEEAIKEWLINWIIRNQQFRRDEIDLDKNIMSYGIDSLSAVTLEQEISEKFGFQWHVSSFMLNPTINKLAEEGMAIFREED
jgi:acyl-CoA synthetase (AMP-forming)/AMP-acid ligase II/acyl carrier protein